MKRTTELIAPSFLSRRKHPKIVMLCKLPVLVGQASRDEESITRFDAMKHYWIGVASHEDVRKAVVGGFCQFSHGSSAAVRRVQRGDGVAYYSPRSQMRSGDPVQAFTAIGIVCAGDPEQASDGGTLRSIRRKIYYAHAITPARKRR